MVSIAVRLIDSWPINREYVRKAGEAAAAERALRAEPTNAYLMRRLGQAHRNSGDYERATAVYERCIASFAGRNLMEQAVEVYLELLQYNETPGLPPEVRLKLARQLEPSRPQDAVAAYRLLVERYPNQPETEQALLRLSALYSQRLGQPFEAARWLDEFLRRFPGSEWATQAREARAALEQQLRRG